MITDLSKPGEKKNAECDVTEVINWQLEISSKFRKQNKDASTVKEKERSASNNKFGSI